MKREIQLVGNVLVTGGAGYIGSHACKSLKKAGYNPVTLDCLVTGWAEAVKYGPFVHGNLLNRADINRAFELYSPVAVMHFAALTVVPESVQQPGRYWENNVMGSLNLIQATVDHGCKNFIFSSTCAIYGEQDNIVLDENSFQKPSNAYSASKRAVENILFDFEVAYGLKHVIFRYFNVAGADPEGEVGEFHRPETHLIPLILDAAEDRLSNLTLYGTDYYTPDGTCIRDYVHVCDLVDAHFLGLKWLEEGKKSRAFNLGTGQGFSVRQVIEHAQKVTNSPIGIIEADRRQGDCAVLVSGSTRAVSELGWSSPKSNLQQMISDAWLWHRTGGFLK